MINGVTAQESSTPRVFTVGVLIDSVESYFNKRAIGDLIDAAEERSLRVVFFFGGACDEGKTAGPYSYSFSLPHKDNVDALIVLPHSIAPCNPETSGKTIADSFKDIPVYSLFGNIREHYSVWTRDNVPIEMMIRHLAKDHGYKRFAFLLGADTDESVSRERMRIILRELENNGIKPDPNLFFRGNFTADSGKTAAKEIYNGGLFSGVCMSQRSMAIGASRIRQSRHRRPEDLAVWVRRSRRKHYLPCTPRRLVSLFGTWFALMDRSRQDLSGDTEYTAEVSKCRKVHASPICGCTSCSSGANVRNGLFAHAEKTLSPGTMSAPKSSAVPWGTSTKNVSYRTTRGCLRTSYFNDQPSPSASLQFFYRYIL
jgi:DNA-binding LacI/PurR family transcriptional regulator